MTAPPVPPLRAAAFLSYLLSWTGFAIAAIWQAWPQAGKTRRTVRTVPAQVLGITGQTMALMLVCAFVPKGSLRPPDWAGAIALLLTPASLFLFVSCVLAQRRATGDAVLASGPYAWVRHPIYTALGGMLLATGAILGTLTGSLLGFSLYLASTEWRVQDEEAELLTRLGDSYREYRRNVRHRYLPGIF